MQRQVVPCYQVLPISGVQHFQAFCHWFLFLPFVQCASSNGTDIGSQFPHYLCPG